MFDLRCNIIYLLLLFLFKICVDVFVFLVIILLLLGCILMLCINVFLGIFESGNELFIKILILFFEIIFWLILIFLGVKMYFFLLLVYVNK